MRICDLMYKGVFCCYPDDSAREVAKIMAANRIRSVVVTDPSGEVWGLVHIMDLLRHYGKDFDQIQAEDIMRPYKIEVDALWPIDKAIALMKKKKYEHLIIVDPNAGPKRPVAILTSFDIVHYMSGINSGKFERLLKMEAVS